MRSRNPITVILLFFISILPYFAQAQSWQAQWISAANIKNDPNTWLAFRKQAIVKKVPAHAIAKIAADSKYWLWINGRQVVFEGSLKRGPNPADAYYDEVDIAPYLKTGQNTIAVLVWYFGKDGFSHKGSGKAGLLFDCQTTGLSVLSDNSWKCTPVSAYQAAGAPLPNYRLSEISILYDARLDMGNWQAAGYNDSQMSAAISLGKAGSAPWNKLVLRPIPMWKDFGMKPYVSLKTSPSAVADTLIGSLPYNAQITPYIKLQATAGQKIIICTDNYLFNDGGETNIRAEYITKDGIQEYENLGWLNGQKVYYIIPKGIKVLGSGYRETGYDTEFAGSFTSSDSFLNTLWLKALRTLYVTMRDTYMDCPDRERAQWTGDATNESGEAFYALSPSSHALTKKWLHELIGWQKADGGIYSPSPSGTWTTELPDQSAASIGYFGLWNYYLHTADKQTITNLYDGTKRYMDQWKLNDKGTIILRNVGWVWGDWGDDRDIMVIYNSWYYLAIKGLHNMAVELGKTDDAAKYAATMATLKTSFNQQFWNGTAYRDPAYTNKTDDRAQALAVVSGLADKDKYPAILKVLQTEEHASPYMEKYVFEAMFIMGYEKEAIERNRKRFGRMVDNKQFTTLFEGWGIGKEGFGGGTVNHAWSGGGLTVISQYLCGIAPTTPGYKTFQILPQPGPVAHASAEISSVAGKIKSSFTNTNETFTLNATVPAGTIAVVGLPGKAYRQITVNGVRVWHNGRYVSNKYAKPDAETNSTHTQFKIGKGNWKVVGRR
ncbi:MAG: glycoside hydrolase, partial [Sphingobacteriales bacterium]